MGCRPKSPLQGLEDVSELSIWLICTISKKFKSYSTSLFWVRLGKSMGRRPKSPPQGLEDVLELSIWLFGTSVRSFKLYSTSLFWVRLGKSMGHRPKSSPQGLAVVHCNAMIRISGSILQPYFRLG